MPTTREVMSRWWPGTHRVMVARGRASSPQARTRRVMDHALIRFAICAAWLIALASIVSWATGYALEL
jgi:hypothetical protein